MRDELWIKHDARSRLDPKMAYFLKLEGMAGYGIFWSLIEILHYQNNHEIDLNIELVGIADQLKLEEIVLQNVVRSLVKSRLFKQDGPAVFQSRLKQDQAKRSNNKQNLAKTRSEAGRRGGQVRVSKGKNKHFQPEKTPIFDENFAYKNAVEKQAFCLKPIGNEINELEANDKQSQANALEREIREIRIERTNTTSVVLDKKVRAIIEVVFPSRWGEKSKAGFQKWKSYRAEIKKPLKTPSLQAQVNKYAEDPQMFVRLVDRAIETGWQGLNPQIPFGDPQNVPTQKKSQNLINQELSLDAVRSVLQDCGYEVGRDGLDVGEGKSGDAEFNINTTDDKSVA